MVHNIVRISEDDENLIEEAHKLYKYKHSIIAHVLINQDDNKKLSKKNVDDIVSAVFNGYLSRPPTQKERQQKLNDLLTPKKG